MNIREELFKLKDDKYKAFNGKLIPTVSPELIIGVRTPQLRKFAKELSFNGSYGNFLEQLPHKYYEENNLHAFLIEQINDFDSALTKTELFLPYIDNWATCDCFSPKVFAANKQELLPRIYEWIKSENTYTVRYAIGLLMKYFLDDDFNQSFLETVAGIKSDEYYINMMIAWYFATALSKQYSTASQYIKECRLDTWIHNKTIQKAVESYRISDEKKDLLKKYKIKVSK